MPSTTVQSSLSEYETKEGTKESEQLTTTIPADLAEAIGISAGDEIEWGVQSGDRLWVGKQ